MSIQNLTVRIGADISNLSRGLREATQQVTTFQSNLRRGMEQLGRMGTVAAGAGIAIGAGLTGAVKTAADFDTAMRKAGAIAGASTDEFNAMKNAAIDLGSTTSKSATEVANAFTELAAKGFDANQVIAAMPGIIHAAEASGEDLALVSDTVSSALNAFGMEAADASKVADVLAMTANQSAAGVLDMQYAFKYAAGPAASLGVSMEELAAATGLMVDAGATGEQAGTTLRASLLRLVKPPKMAQKALEELGVSAVNQDGSFKSLKQIIAELQKGMEGMTDAQKAASLAAIFGTESVSGMMTLVAKGPDVLGDFTTALENSAGASQEAAEKMKAGIGGSIEQLTGAIESLAISFGDKLVPYVKQAADFIAGLVNQFNSLSESTKSMIAIGAALSAGLLVVGGMFLMIVGFIPSIIAGFTALTGLLPALGTAFTVLTGPVGLIVAAIAAVIAAVVLAYNKCEWFRTAVTETWEGIKTAFSTALSFISGIVQSVIGAVAGFIGSKLSEIRAFWDENGAAISKLAEFYFKAIQTYITFVMGAIMTVFKTVWPAVSGIVKVAWALIQSVIGTAITAVLGIISAVMSALEGDWSGAWGRIKETASTIMDNIVSYFEGIDLVQIGKDIIAGLISGLGSMAGSVASKVRELSKLIPDGLRDFLGIHSPSRVLMQLGEYTGEGFQVGLDNSIKQIRQSAGKLAGAAVPSLDYQTPVMAGQTIGTQVISERGDSNDVGPLLQKLDRKLDLFHDLSVHVDGQQVGRIVSPAVGGVMANESKLNTYMRGYKR